MKAKGEDLIFISRIKRDGSGVEFEENYDHNNNDMFTIIPLSLTRKTFIAISINAYVVKVKNWKLVEAKNKSEY